jgi:hypothetical protein
LDEGSIGVGFLTAKLMIQMSDDEIVRFGLDQRPQKGNAVRPTGYGDDSVTSTT